QNRWRPVLPNHRLFPMILAILSIIALSAGCTHMQFARQWNASKQTPPANRSLNPLLINAVINRQHKRLAQLLRQGVDPNALVPYGRYNQERAVHLCVRNDDSTALRILIAAGANLSYGDERGETALIQAIYYDRPAMARYLLEQGANPNLRMRNGLTALHVAADRGYTDVARALLLAGADANARTNSGISPLMLAAKRYESLVRLLLAHRARVNQTTEAGTTALMYAAHTGAHPIVRILLDAGARADMRRSDGKDALYFASAPHYYRFDLATTIQLLLDAGVNPDQTYGERNLTALMLTAEWNLLGPMQTLLANGVDLHRRDAHGRSAADYCRTDDCRNLLSAQESIDTENTLLPDELPQTEEIRETEQAIFQNSQPPTLADMRQAVQANQNPLILLQNYLDYFMRRGYWLDPEANARRTDIIAFLLEAIRTTKLPIDNQLVDELWRFQQATDDRLPEILLKHNIIGLPVYAACTDALYRYIQSDRTDRFAAIEYYVLQSNVWECADAAARVIALLDAGAPAP
ncbi:MAG: ankyrin repeat domain-containing protein, partial [Leptospiraceae bacterium]|nr:ankyrin repeat domain-containing protein [Leptospiraceae bacterium]